MWIQIAFFANSVFFCYGHFIADFITIEQFPDNECGNQLKAFKTALGNDETWALTLLDASAKLQSGIFNGNIYNLGDFDECLAIKGETSIGIIEGKYCLASIALEGFGIFLNKEMRSQADRVLEGMQPGGSASSGIYARIGVCIPSACTADDINGIIDNTLSVKFKLTDSNCQTASRGIEITTGDVATMYIACMFALLLITSTAYDVYLYYSNKSCKSTLLLSFSILTNGQKLFTVTDNDKYLSCLAGIRTLTLMWIILAHSFCMDSFRPLTNYRSMYELAQNTWSMYILGGMVSVDTFFLVSGTVLTYCFLTHIKQFRLVDLPLFYFHRYIRLVPCLAAILLVQITVLKHIGSGPMWPLSEAFTSDCDKNWWKLLTFTQNVSPNYKCLNVAWYVACDTQLFMVSPLVLIQLRKRPRQVLKIIALLALLSISYSLWYCWSNNYTPFRVPTDEYMSATTRASPWLIGIVLGYIIYTRKYNNLKLEINKFLVAFLWIAAAIVMIACVFGGNHLVTDPYGHRLESALRISLVRPAWALAIGWIIFACVSGYGGPINAFLSLPIFQIQSRFGYSMYLLHWTILTVISMSTRISIQESNFRQVYMFWSIYMLTFFVSVIWTLAFEIPFVAMENYFLRDNKNHVKGASQEQLDTNYVKVKI